MPAASTSSRGFDCFYLTKDRISDNISLYLQFEERTKMNVMKKPPPPRIF